MLSEDIFHPRAVPLLRSSTAIVCERLERRFYFVPIVHQDRLVFVSCSRPPITTSELGHRESGNCSCLADWPTQYLGR